jgi:hypothetical protein
MFKFFLSLITLVTISVAATAQSVRIDARDIGQGFMFKDSGICWVLMPRHLLDGDANRFEAETSPAPSVFGNGSAFTDFWAGFDFAIGNLRQAAGDTACTATLEDISQTRVVAGRVQRGFLRYVEVGGNIADYPMAIVDTGDHKTFDAEFTRDGDSAFQGMSGGFFFAQGAPVGMVTKSPDGASRMTFIRIEEIAFATRRWLEGRARNVVIVTSAQAENDGQLPLRLLGYDTPSVSPGTSAEGLADAAGAYHFDFTGPTTLTFGVGDDGAAVGISRVRVVSEGDGAKPLGIRVLIDPSEAGGNPQRFARGEMPPDGEFDTTPRAERFARRVIIAIDSVQGSGPVHIDRVEVY